MTYFLFFIKLKFKKTRIILFFIQQMNYRYHKSKNVCSYGFHFYEITNKSIITEVRMKHLL